MENRNVRPITIQSIVLTLRQFSQ